MKEDMCQTMELFRKSFRGELDEEERELLGKVLQNEALRVVYEQLGDEKFLIEKFRELEEYSYREAFRKLEKRHYRKIIRQWSIWGGSVAAAVIIAVLWIYRDVQPGERMGYLLAEQSVVPPGKKQAILTLSDGRVVRMDNTPVEIPVGGGNSVKYEEGGLSYAADTKITRELLNELVIPAGGECHVRLEDGTVVWLNADSKLTYPVAFVGEERKVVLEGEAYFEVTRDMRPFIVNTRGGEITVLGTSFGVTTYAGKPGYTTLVKGQVRFTSGTHESVILAPGEQAVVYESGKLVTRKVSVEEYVGWKDGVFVFREKALGEIMETLQRWYGVTVVFRDERLKNLMYTGEVGRYDTINTFLQLLERLKEIRYEVRENSVTIYQN